jgi:hypothetical protein
MTDINRFHTEFVERTREILEKYQGEREWTNLLNCTLGLIVLPFKQLEDNGGLKNDIWGQDISTIPECHHFTIARFTPIKKRTRDGFEFYSPTLGVLLRKLRNGLCHQNIEPSNESGKWDSITVRNHYEYGNSKPKKKEMDLEVTFTWPQLKGFALFIAEEYLKTQKQPDGT